MPIKNTTFSQELGIKTVTPPEHEGTTSSLCCDSEINPSVEGCPGEGVRQSGQDTNALCCARSFFKCAGQLLQLRAKQPANVRSAFRPSAHVGGPVALPA